MTEQAPSKEKAAELRALQTRLKSGEYDGTDIMRAWIWIAEYAHELEKQASAPEPPAVHLHCDACDWANCKGVPAAAHPPRAPSPEWVLRARAEGRAEFLVILLGLSAEDFASDYTGDHPIGDTGDYGAHWEVEKLRAQFAVDDDKYSYIDNINGAWWSQQARIDDLEDQVKRAAPPPRNVQGAIFDRLGWICSVCHGWNHQQDVHCTHTHSGSVSTKAGE